jgi:hypothetical protein
VEAAPGKVLFVDVISLQDGEPLKLPAYLGEGEDGGVAGSSRLTAA